MRTEVEKLHRLYLDMSEEAILLYDSDHFLETIRARVRELLQDAGAERHAMGMHWYWDLKRAFPFGETVQSGILRLGWS